MITTATDCYFIIIIIIIIIIFNNIIILKKKDHTLNVIASKSTTERIKKELLQPYE